MRLEQTDPLVEPAGGEMDRTGPEVEAGWIRPADGEYASPFASASSSGRGAHGVEGWGVWSVGIAPHDGYGGWRGSFWRKPKEQEG